MNTKEIEIKLRDPKSIIILNNIIYKYKRSCFNIIYYNEYFKDKFIKSEYSNDISIDIKESIIDQNGLNIKYELYDALLSQIIFIEEKDVQTEFMKCLQTRYKESHQSVSDTDKQIREELHTSKLIDILNGFYMSIGNSMYNASAKSFEAIILDLTKDISYTLITSYKRYPAYLNCPNLDGVKRNEKEYVDYIIDKALKKDCEFSDSSDWLAYVFINKVKEIYPILNIDKFEGLKFKIWFKAEISDSLL